MAASLRELVGHAQPGDRLPPSRELTRRLGVSPVTVSRAIAQLAAEGAVTTRPGAGTYVAQARMTALDRRDHGWQTIALGSHTVDDSGMRALVQDPVPGTISLAGGYPHPSLAPSRSLAAAMARAARRPGTWERPALNGMLPLRRWFADAVGPSVGADDVLVTTGGQSGLSVAVRATSPAGSAILVESPTYPGLLAIARAAGLRVVPVPVDDGGVRPDMLEEAFARTGARVLYCQPTYQNPTGSVMDATRRTEVLRVAAAAGAFVIEDDWARWLAHATPPPPPLVAGDADGRVIHVRSLTKCVAASLRIGAVIARGPIAERLRALHLVDALFVPGPMQEAALDFLSSSAWPRHLSSLNAALRLRKRALLSTFATLLPEVALSHAPGGFYAWGRLPAGVDDVDAAAAGAAAGVVVAPGRPFFPAEPPGAFMRFSFAAPADLGDVEEGVRRLARALQRA